MSPSIWRLQDWVRGLPTAPEARLFIARRSEQARGQSATEEQDGLAGKRKEAENDEAHRARVRAEADPRDPNQVLPGHLR